MGFRFRKTIKLGPVNVNLSKSGVGYSIGGKGLRVTKKADGGTRTTVSIPGTGISHVTETSGKKKTNPESKHPVIPKTACQAEKIEPAIKKIKFPTVKDGHPIRYAYELEIEPVPGLDILHDILNGSEKIIKAIPAGDAITLRDNGRVLGRILDPQKAEMLMDWIQKKLPYDAILLASGHTVNLRFYQDKRMGQDHREQTVIALTGFKAMSKQDAIDFLDPGEEVELEENYNREDAVDVLANGIDKIGSLPKKIAQRYLEEGAYGAFFEKGEPIEDDNGNYTKPYIRIYW